MGMESPGQGATVGPHLCAACVSLKQRFPKRTSLTTYINHLGMPINSEDPGPQPMNLINENLGEEFGERSEF